MVETKVATRYAKSLIGLAQEQNSLDEVNRDMDVIRVTIHKSKDLSAFLNNPTIKTDTKIKALNQIFADKIGKLSLSIMHLITKKRREAYLEAIATQFISMHKEQKGIKTVYITSSAGLDEKMRASVFQMLKDSTNKEIELIENIDKNLIGGFILRMDDKQYDASISTALHKFNKELLSNVYLRKN